MANLIFQPPIKGVSLSLPFDAQPPATSGHMLNVRPVDTLESRLRIGQRPGLDKKFAQQMGGGLPIVEMVNIVTVD